MKKIALFICMACVAMGMSAQTITGRSKIILSSAGETDKEVRLILSNSFSNDWDNTWDATPAQDGGIYVFYQGAKYSIWASNEYSENLPLAFDANANTTYRLSFASFLNVPYTIKDLEENHTISVGASILVDGVAADYYDFTIDAGKANTTINDRFVINYVAPAPVYAAEVTTNANGLATFSYNADLQAVESDVKLYKGDLNGNELVLSGVNYVKANQGVIVYGAANTTYHFNVGTGTSDFTGNDLLPASAWDYAAQDGYSIYVLSGNMLYLYEGTNMKPNKAFLKVNQNPISGNAPARISMRFNGTQDVENAEVEDAKAVKFVENGEIFIRRGNEVYNLQGQIVK